MTIEDMRFSDKSIFSDSECIIDRITDGIEAPVPDTCRYLWAYVTGANQCVDWLGEGIALGKLLPGSTQGSLPKWKQIDQWRYARAQSYIIGTGNQPLGGKYGPYRKLVGWLGAEQLALYDAERLRNILSPNRVPYTGVFVDNWANSPGDTFPQVACCEYLAMEALETYVATLLGQWSCSVVINCKQPNVWRLRNGTAIPQVEAVRRNRNWWRKLGIDGVYYEADGIEKRTSEEQAVITAGLKELRDDGFKVIIGRTLSTEWPAYTALREDVSGHGNERNVYWSH